MDPLKQHLLSESHVSGGGLPQYYPGFHVPPPPPPPPQRKGLSMTNSLLALILCMLVPFAIGYNGYRVAHDADWYGSLKKPSFMPPQWVFHAVWTVIYFTSGLGSYLIFRQHAMKGTDINLPTFSYIISLFLNGAWSHLFFGQRWFTISVIDTAVLWVAVVACVVLFYRISRPASYMMMPYAGWLIFEFVLNAWIAMYNPHGGRGLVTTENIILMYENMPLQ
jgi:tryptophan-rich sensory protein